MMKNKKWSVFLAIPALTLGMGLFMNPGHALADPEHDKGGKEFKENKADKESNGYNFSENNGNKGKGYNNGIKYIGSNGSEGPSVLTVSVPEPSTLLLLGGGIVGFALYARKRARK